MQVSSAGRRRDRSATCHRQKARRRRRSDPRPGEESGKLAEPDGQAVTSLRSTCSTWPLHQGRGASRDRRDRQQQLGSGQTSPAAWISTYQNLCAAARRPAFAGWSTPFRGSTDAFVDIFKIKWYVEDAIRRSGVPHVMLRPTAFMDVWIDQLLADGIRKKGVAMIFGDGKAVANYIAVDDVAEFAVRILGREDVVNEVVEVGGPSNISFDDLATLIERRLGASGKRRHIPIVAMKLLPPLIRPFKELPARLMTLGLYAATRSQPFPGWKAAADRFGVMPRTIETYLQEMKN
jgi:hypothetical protein